MTSKIINIQIALLATILFTSTILGSTQFSFAQESKYTIVAVGDWDCNSETKKTVANIQKVNPDVVLSLGDMSYTGSADCWLDEIAPIKDKMMITEGNHDGNYDDYMAAFGITGKWYSKEVPEANAIFVAVNTEESLKEGSPQLDFVEKALTDTDMAWKITFMHKPSITYGHHSSDESSPETLLPLYDKTKTSLELGGHNHFMQEIYPTVDGPKKVAPGEGTVHIVSGGGGRDLYEFENNEVVAQTQADHGIVVVDLLDDKNAKAKFISNDGDTIPLGDIVNRNAPVGPPPPPPKEICDNGIDDDGDGLIDKADVIDCPTIPPPPPPPPTGNSSQISINNNIQSTTWYGDFKRPDYVAYYNVKKMFDNITNVDSSWGQNGKSGFKVILNEPIDRPLCKVEVSVLEPLNQDYHIHMFDSQAKTLLDFSNKLGASNETININGCINGVKQVDMDFNTPDEKWLNIQEIKLFSNTTVIPPPPPQEVCNDGIDNDKDGLIDAADPDCKLPPPPPPPPPPSTGNGTLNIVNGTATINAMNTDFTIIINDNNTSIETNDTDTDLNETDIDSPLILNAGGH